VVLSTFLPTLNILCFYISTSELGLRGGAVGLDYKPEGLGFYSRWDHWDFSLNNFTMVLGSTQPPTQISVISLGVKTAGA
jgi:hypothetical protein